MPRRQSYNLAPRYTAGSPALVYDRALAERVAGEEKDAYQRHLEGIYGEDAKARAEEQGLRGIVEQRKVFAHHFLALDMITGEQRDSRKSSVAQRKDGARCAN
jgi:hypothetical protein